MAHQLPPELNEHLKSRYAELMQPLDLEAELRRIDAKLAEQHKLMQAFATENTEVAVLHSPGWSDRKLVTVMVVVSLLGAAVAAAAGAFAVMVFSERTVLVLICVAFSIAGAGLVMPALSRR